MSAPTPQPDPDLERKRRERRNGLIFLGTLGTVILIFVLAGLAGATFSTGSSGPPPTATPAICRLPNLQPASDQLRADAQDFADAVKLADSTPRVALAPQIQRMQTLRQTAQGRRYPACAGVASAALIDMENAYIDGYIAFLGQDAGYTDTIKHANDLAITAAAELAKLTP